MLPKGNFVRRTYGFVHVLVLLYAVCVAELRAENQHGLHQLTQNEFRNLSAELAGKVDLFRDVWSKSPGAEVYGGTARDFLYWVKGKFKDVKSRDEAEKVIVELRALPQIAVRDFMMHDSDADVVSKTAIALNISDYGLRKLDIISGEAFDPNTEMGKNERMQGHIPVEKIRLAKTGFVDWAEFGDGLGEIYRGNLTVRFGNADEFKETFYAKRNENHPVLLALRFIRQISMNHFREHGKEYPDMKRLLDIDPESLRQVKQAVHSAMVPGALDDHFKQPRFQAWINGSIDKAFRSYTNPTATHLLFKETGLDRFVEQNAGRVMTINQFLFAKYRDPKVVSEHRAEFNLDPSKTFTSAESMFPNRNLYHGTKTEAAFRSILFQGILPSAAGTAGDGLYGVASNNIPFADNWGGSPDRTVVFKVKPDAVIADIREGGSARPVWDAFRSKYPGKSESDFADYFGVDILKYPYSTEAFVVKNSSVLEEPNGYRRRIMPFHELLALAKRASHSDEELLTLMDLLSLNQLRKDESELLRKTVQNPARFDEVNAIRTRWDKQIDALLKDSSIPMYFLHPSAFEATREELRSLGLMIWLASKPQNFGNTKFKQQLAVKLENVMRIFDQPAQALKVQRATFESNVLGSLFRGESMIKEATPEKLDQIKSAFRRFQTTPDTSATIAIANALNHNRENRRGLYHWKDGLVKWQAYGTIASLVGMLPALLATPEPYRDTVGWTLGISFAVNAVGTMAMPFLMPADRTSDYSKGFANPPLETAGKMRRGYARFETLLKSWAADSEKLARGENPLNEKSWCPVWLKKLAGY